MSVHASKKKEACNQAQSGSEAQNQKEKGCSEAQAKGCKAPQAISYAYKNSVLCAVDESMVDSTEFLIPMNYESLTNIRILLSTCICNLYICT